MAETLVLSSSALKLFKDCRKAYQLGYEKNLDPFSTNDAVAQGSSFHKHIELLTKGEVDEVYDDMRDIAVEYERHNPLPPWADVIVPAETPMYTPLIEGVVLRTTFDLLYRKGDEIYIRDYKTFEKAPTLDLDLDFQSRIYIAAVMRQYRTQNVTFEYEFVRRTLPNVPKDKAGKHWEIDDCYKNFPIVISAREARDLWQETQWVAQDILDAKGNGRYYREDRKGFGGCTSCFYKELCKSENQLGYLDEQTVRMLARPREQVTMEAHEADHSN